MGLGLGLGLGSGLGLEREAHLVTEVLELGRSETPPLDELLHLPPPRRRQRYGQDVLRLLAAPGEG